MRVIISAFLLVALVLSDGSVAWAQNCKLFADGDLGWCKSLDEPGGIAPDPGGVPDQPHDYYGPSMAGVLENTNQGGAQYTLDLAVPPGRNGIEPSLQVAYHSTASDGFLGRGFSLRGMDQISECQLVENELSSIGHIKFLRPPSQELKTFCYNGEPLRPRPFSVDGRPVEYGVSGSPLRVFPSWDNGRVTSFTALDGTGISRTFVSETGTGVFELHLVEDSWGNRMEFEYRTPSDEEARLDKITYTASSSLAGSREVQFHYEERPAPIRAFRSGRGVHVLHRINKISMMIHGDEVWHYAVEYVREGQESELESLSRCGSDGVCSAPIRFTWSEHTEPELSQTEVVTEWRQSDGEPLVGMSNVVRGDFDGDGNSDTIFQTNIAKFLGITPWHKRGWFISDSTLGVKEVFYVPSDASQCVEDTNCEWTCSETGFCAKPYWDESIAISDDFGSTGANIRYGRHNVKVLDFNGDGIDDFFREYSVSGKSGPAARYYLGTRTPGLFVEVTPGYDIADQVQGAYEFPLDWDRDYKWSVLRASPGHYGQGIKQPIFHRTFFVDFTGDGLPDQLVCDEDSQGGYSWELRVHQGTTLDTKPIPDALGVSCKEASEIPNAWFFMDVDGNGTVDLLQKTADGRVDSIHYDPTSATPAVVRQSDLTWTSPFEKWVPLQFNGDGLTDLAVVYLDEGIVRIFENTGESWSFAQEIRPVVPSQASENDRRALLNYIFPMDWDGDGKDDLVYPHAEACDKRPQLMGRDQGPVGTPTRPYYGDDCFNYEGRGATWRVFITDYERDDDESLDTRIPFRHHRLERNDLYDSGDDFVGRDTAHAAVYPKQQFGPVEWQSLTPGERRLEWIEPTESCDLKKRVIEGSGLDPDSQAWVWRGCDYKTFAKTLQVNPRLIVAIDEDPAVDAMPTYALHWTTFAEAQSTDYHACQYPESCNTNDSAPMLSGVDTYVDFGAGGDVHETRWTYFDFLFDRFGRGGGFKLIQERNSIPGVRESLEARVWDRSFKRSMPGSFLGRYSQISEPIKSFRFDRVDSVRVIWSKNSSEISTMNDWRDPIYSEWELDYIASTDTEAGEIVSFDTLSFLADQHLGLDPNMQGPAPEGAKADTVIETRQVDSFGRPLFIERTSGDATEWQTFNYWTPIDLPIFNNGGNPYRTDSVVEAAVVSSVEFDDGSIDSQEYKSWFGYDSNQNLEWRAANAGGQCQRTDFTFDEFGNTVFKDVWECANNGTSTQGTAVRTAVEFDQEGYFPAKTINSMGHESSVEVDERFALPTKVIDIDQTVTRSVYDSFGRLVEVIAPDGRRTRNEFGYVEDFGWIRRTVRNQVSGQGEAFRVLSGSGAVLSEYWTQDRNWVGQRYWYDAAGQVESISLPTSNLANPPIAQHFFEYDMMGRRTWEQDAVGAQTTVEFSVDNARNRITTVTAPNGGQTIFTRAPNGQPLSTQDALGGVTTYEHGAMGRMISLVGPTGDETTYAYDSAGRLTWMNDPDHGEWTYGYDLFGNPVFESAVGSGNSHSVTREFDALGRVTRVIADSGEIDEFHYDSLAGAGSGGQGPGTGKLSSSISSDGIVTSQFYDTFGRVLSRTIDVPNGAAIDSYRFDFNYDSFGRVDQLTYPADNVGWRPTVGFDYTDEGILETVKEGTFELWRLGGLTPFGGLARERLNNGLIDVDYEWNHESQKLMRKRTWSGTSLVEHKNFNYDISGNTVARQNHIAGQFEEVTYDLLHRVIGANQCLDDGGPCIATSAVQIDYDPTGRITHKSDVGNYTYGAAQPNAVSAVGTTSFEYDWLGRQTVRPGWETAYNFRHKPSQMNSDFGAQIDFAYDAGGDQIVKTAAAGADETRTVNLGMFQQIDTVTAGVSTNAFKYDVVAFGRTIATFTGTNGTGDWRYHSTDVLGSRELSFESSGAVVSEMSYDVFGAPRDPDDWSIRLSGAFTAGDTNGFTGHQALDDFGLGLVDMGARTYDPVVGRFLSPDPVVPSFTNSQALNRYSYVFNNPLGWTDPTGHWPIDLHKKLDEDVSTPPPPDSSSGSSWLAEFWAWLLSGSGRATAPTNPDHFTRLTQEFPVYYPRPDSHPAQAAGGTPVSAQSGASPGSGSISNWGVAKGGVKFVVDHVGTNIILASPALGPFGIVAAYGIYTHVLPWARPETQSEQIGFFGALGMSVLIPGAAWARSLKLGATLGKIKTVFNSGIKALRGAGQRLKSKTIELFDWGKSRFLRPTFCSFTAGTMVLLCSGQLVAIETIEEGDWVLAQDDETGEVACKEVKHPYANPHRSIIRLTLSNDAGESEVVETTDNHPFYVLDRGWTRVDELEIGDRVPAADGGVLQVGSVEWTARVETVYNFGVEGYHTYFVGELGAWVHNCFEGGTESALRHWNKHRSEFPALNNAKEYVESARSFLKNPGSDSLIYTRPRDGRTMVYNPNTKEFGVLAADGSTPSTYFILDATKTMKPGTNRVYRNNLEYWNHNK